MRHGKRFNHLGRTASHRKAMLANMSVSLITSEKKRIVTTLAKAKALRGYLEPLVTKAKNDTTHSRRVVFSYLKSKEAIAELFGEIAMKIADRPGGYLRILKLGPRKGDGAEMALIEFVDFNEFYEPKAKKTSRRRRKSKPKAKEAAAPVVEKQAEEVVEEVVEETAETVVEETAVEEPVEETTDEASEEETSGDAEQNGEPVAEAETAEEAAEEPEEEEKKEGDE